MASEKRLIVNADDFGLSPGVNRGIIGAHERGIVTSASLMTRWPASADAAAYARANRRLGMGLHVDMGEWVYRNRRWQPLYEVVAGEDAGAVRAEANHQLDAFRRLVGSDPDHLDSHQHAHRDEPLRSILLELAGELRVPLRHFAPHISYCGDFYGQGERGASYPELVGVERACRILRRLSPGTTELCCHPSAAADVDTMYLQERLIELRTLCDPKVRATIRDEGIRLCSFAHA